MTADYKKADRIPIARMQKTKGELYKLVSDLKTKKEFEQEIKSRGRQFEDLVDEDTIALLLVDELGRNTHSITEITMLQPDKDFTVVGRVISISDTKTFKRKNGTTGKVVNLEISDKTGTCRLVLWNDDIDQIENRGIQNGTTVKVINGYTKQAYAGGLEINLGRWGQLEVDSTKPQALNESTPAYDDEITGVLTRKEATRAFFKEDGEIGFVTTIDVNAQGQTTQITVWDQCVKDIQKFKQGDCLTLKHVVTKQNNGKKEFHINGNGVIKKDQ